MCEAKSRPPKSKGPMHHVREADYQTVFSISESDIEIQTQVIGLIKTGRQMSSNAKRRITAMVNMHSDHFALSYIDDPDEAG